MEGFPTHLLAEAERAGFDVFLTAEKYSTPAAESCRAAK